MSHRNQTNTQKFKFTPGCSQETWVSPPQRCPHTIFTPRTVTCEERGNGKYVYFGLETGILQHITQSPNFRGDIEVILNVDGVYFNFGPHWHQFKIQNHSWLHYFVQQKSPTQSRTWLRKSRLSTKVSFIKTACTR